MLTALRLFVALTALNPASGPPAYPHIRTENARIGRLIAIGAERSGTIRRLAAALADSDVIVYIDTGDCDCRRAQACLSFVVFSGGVRYLRASVSLKQIDDFLIEQLGHELQHAVEIVPERGITSESSLAAYYESHAQNCGVTRCYETAEAKRVEQAVRRELRR